MHEKNQDKFPLAFELFFHPGKNKPDFTKKATSVS